MGSTDAPILAIITMLLIFNVVFMIRGIQNEFSVAPP